MGHESLSLFPSESERDTKPVAPAFPGRPPDQRTDEQPLAMFGTVEGAAPSPSARVRASGRRTPVAIVASIAVLALTGLALLRPANSAPSDKPRPVAVPSAPPVDVVNTPDVQAAPSVVQAAPSVEAPPPPAPAPALAPITPAAVRAPALRPRATARNVEPRPERRAMSSAKAPAFTGVLIVDSVPRGAAVTMNQKPLGVTPLRLPAHPAGSYAIWVEHEGFERWTAGVRVAANTTTRVNPTLRSRSLVR